jgi:Xaa-Pro aminopeptidase
MADNLYGSSQAFDEHKKAAEGANAALTKFSNFISSIFSPIVDDNGKIKSSPTSSNPINDVIKDADEVKKAFIDTLRSVNSPEVISAFRQAMAEVAVAAAKEAIPQVLREMRQAQ